MQSFGDDTLLDCINVERRNRISHEQNASTSLYEKNSSDLDEYFKQSSLFSEFVNSDNGDDIGKSKQSHPASSTKETGKKNESDFGKYFEDSTIFPKTNGKKNFPSASSICEQNETASSQRNRNKAKKKNVNIINSKKKDTFDVNNVVQRHDNSNTETLHKNKAHDNMQDTVYDNVATSLISNTPDEEEKNIIPSPPLCTQDRCKLASWGLPSNILQKYIARGIECMFAWQMECLSNHKVMQEKKNLVYSAPTSAGKTLVAEILMIKTVLERKKKAIFILPFVSVVREKMYYFQDLLSDSGIRVEGFMGGAVPPGGFAATHIAVATIEKANSLVNRLMEEDDLGSLGAVVIDELHLLGDPNRGYLLELLLTKLKYMTIRNNYINIQLIGMSATLPNLALLAKWLNAELYNTEFRPIPLNEYCKIGTNIYDHKLNFVRKLAELSELKVDVDNILQLCIETISNGHSVLIFCPTKKWCEKLAEQIATVFFRLGSENTMLGEMLKKEINSTLIHETLEQLKRSPSGLDNILKNAISFGIAFHHAGLTMEERDIIEGSFRTGSLRVLIATSTLSSGVNLPARRVIIRSPLFGGNLLNTLSYKQMIGRAGRMGKDSAGESILICKPNERNTATSLLSANLNPIESCLYDSTLLIRALLEAVASEVLYTSQDLELYINCTLLSFNEQSDIHTSSNKAMKFLLDNEFLLLQTTERESRWIATSLGKACLAASVPPREGLILFEELQKARRCFVLDTELHVIYLVTPLSAGCQIGTVDWMTFNELWNSISESERRVGKLVGVEERFVMSAIRGIVKPGKSLNIHKRFYSALALHDLVNEVSLNTVCKKYGCCRGVLQTLQQSAATYAGMVTQFCKQLRWDCMELLVSQFQTRLQFGVCRELLDLLRLPMLNGLRARSLYKQGITCVADLAVANELNVERALYNALPFESEKEYEGEYTLETEKRNKMRTVFVTGRDGLTPQQAAILLVQEARILLQKELGLEQLPWEQNERSLEINTYSDNVENTCNTKEQSQAEFDIKNSRSVESKVPIAENRIHTKIASNKNRENNGSKPSIRDTSETEVSDKKETIDDQNLSKPILSSKKNDRNSSFDLITFDVTTISEKRPDTSRIKESFSKTGNSTTPKRRDKDLDKLYSNINVSNKKLKTSNTDESRVTYENQMDKNINAPIIDEDIKSSYSSSPSLFDDSLSLDTQLCNVLEQNVTHLSETEETKALASEIDDANILQKNVKVSHSNNTRSCEESNTTKIFATRLQSKNSLLSWDDDSWNDSERLLKKMIQDDDQNVKKKVSKFEIKNIIDIKATVTPRNTITRDNKDNVHKTDVKKSAATIKNKAPRKSKLLKLATTDSPVTSVIVFGNERRTSIDSNTSDSDDVVVGSQHFESPFNGSENRTKMKLEKIRKMRSQKIAENTMMELSDCLNSPIREASSDAAKSKTKRMKPKLKEILTRNLLLAANCGTSGNSAMQCNSEGETIIHSTRSKSKQYEAQANTLTKNVKSKVEIMPQSNNRRDSLSETIDWNTLNIVKVSSNRTTFNLFKREVLKKRNIALALHCEAYMDNANNIGSKICTTNAEIKRKHRRSESYTYENKEIRGVAISWEGNIAYYISFGNSQESKISGKEQMALLKELFSDTALYMKCFMAKDVYKLLYRCCGISAKCQFLDPVIAHWLYTNSGERNFSDMVMRYFPQGNFIAKRTNSYNLGPGMDLRSSLPGEFRSAAEAVLTSHIMDNIMNKLEEFNPVIIHTFREIEMRTVTILACMELSGIGVDTKSLQGLSSIVSNKMQSLETKAYDLAGRKFNFSSSKEVGQILGLYKEKKISTSKSVLEKCDNPISGLVISWRKLSATRTKIIYPLLKSAQGDPRIRGNCITCTATGRVSMHEPNLQNVPKDFSFTDDLVVSVRKAFVPALGNIMLSADYCQLELRLLTHFSLDSVLCEIMKQPGDIFKSIAAKWNNVAEGKVTTEMRQRTKQLCYGMIYGMGVKSLAENLCISETEAQEFLETFMNAYPGIYKWLNDVLEEAHRDGCVTTLLGRRRQLPDLKSTKSSTRAQAERQAVNTKVQGSAADVVKSAMINIEQKMRCSFPDSAMIFSEGHTRKLRSNSGELQQRGGYLILQLHDELLYEINLADLKEVVAIIKESMENVCQLTVPLPVKIKVGPAWGSLTEYQC